MTNQDQAFPYYRSPAAIRNETFSRRMRGLDEDEVREYLHLLADQVQVADQERHEMRAENDRLHTELQEMRTRLADFEDVGERVNDQVVELFSQAQLVAEEMVEDISRDARNRLGQAREQERRIIEEAMQTAERTRREAESMIARVTGLVGGGSSTTAAAPPAQVEQVRSFAQAAQAQMQSIMDAFAAQVAKLDSGAVGRDSGLPSAYQNGSSAQGMNGRQIEAPPSNRPDPWGSV